jgi:hypothetical protein
MYVPHELSSAESCDEQWLSKQELHAALPVPVDGVAP